MINALKLLKIKKKLEGLNAAPRILQNYLKREQRRLLNEAGLQIEKGGEKPEEILKAYFTAAVLSENPKERSDIVSQTVFYLQSLENKVPEEILKTYKWIKGEFEGVFQEITFILEKNELAPLEEKFKILDKEENLLKKDFEQLQNLLEKIKKYSMPKYESAEKRIEREQEASQQLRELIEKLETLHSQYEKKEDEVGELQSELEEDEISNLISIETERIVALAPNYNRQVREYLSEFNQSVDKKKSEIQIRRFENSTDELRKKIYTDFFEFLNGSDGEEIINSLQKKIQRFAEVMEIFRSDIFLEEIKNNGHAWFQTARLNFSQTKVAYLKEWESNKTAKDFSDKFCRFREDIENSYGIFEKAVEKFKNPESKADSLLLDDKKFLEDLLDELNQHSQDVENKKKQEEKSVASEFVEKKTILNRIWGLFSNPNRRKS